MYHHLGESRNVGIRKKHNHGLKRSSKGGSRILKIPMLKYDYKQYI